jgi:serine/threonine-protein kinase HipA
VSDLEVHIERAGTCMLVGLGHINRARGNETFVFEYADTWLANPDRFALEPALPLTRGSFAAAQGSTLFGSISDSAPDTWGRRLMQRAERRAAQRESRSVRTLMETDYLLGVTDFTRLGALRFRHAGEKVFLAQRPGCSIRMGHYQLRSSPKKTTNIALKPERKLRFNWQIFRAFKHPIMHC